MSVLDVLGGKFCIVLVVLDVLDELYLTPTLIIIDDDIADNIVLVWHSLKTWIDGTIPNGGHQYASYLPLVWAVVQWLHAPPMQSLPAPSVHRRVGTDQCPLVLQQMRESRSDLAWSTFSEAHPLAFLSLTAPREEHETEIAAPLYARVTLIQRECCSVKYCHHDLHTFMSVWALISHNLTGS